MGGTPPPPLRTQFSGKRGFGFGGYPPSPLYGQKPQSSIWPPPLWFLTKSFSSKAGNNKVHDTILMQLHKEKLYFHLAPYRHSTPYIRINNETLNTGQIYDTLSKMCLKYNILLMMLRACWKSFLLVLIKSCREGRLFCNPVINQRQERNQKKACDHINCKK